MPHALIPLIKRLADTHLTAVGCYVVSGGYSLFPVSPSKGWKLNGSTFLPPGKYREYVIIVYWMMTSNFFQSDREKLSVPQERKSREICQWCCPDFCLLRIWL